MNNNRVFFIPDHTEAIGSNELNKVYRDVINESLQPDLPPIECIDPIMRVTIDVSTHMRDMSITLNAIRNFDGVLIINLICPRPSQIRLGNIDMGPMQWAKAFSGELLSEFYNTLNGMKAKVIILHGNFRTEAMTFISRGVLVTNAPVVVDVRKRQVSI